MAHGNIVKIDMRSLKTMRFWMCVIIQVSIVSILLSLIYFHYNHVTKRFKADIATDIARYIRTYEQLDIGEPRTNQTHHREAAAITPRKDTLVLVDGGQNVSTPLEDTVNLLRDNKHIHEDVENNQEAIGKFAGQRDKEAIEILASQRNQETMKKFVVQRRPDVMEKLAMYRQQTSMELLAVQRHQEAMGKLANYPYLNLYTSRLFHVVDTFKNSYKYAKIMTMFDNLILDLWDFYKGNGTVAEPRWNSWDADDEQTGRHEINCTNIHQIDITQRLGGGYIKVAYEGDFNGQKVVVKVKNMKNNNYPGVCGWENFTCAVYRDVRILNELLILDHVDHPMFIRVLGYCVHNGIGTASFLDEPGVIGVYEWGQQVDRRLVTSLDWPERMNLAMEIADFLIYVEHSPFGRLTLYDLGVRQFVRARGHICLTDLDLTDNKVDPRCTDVRTQQKLSDDGRNITVCYFKYPFNLGFKFDIPCVDDICLDLGQRHNMMTFHTAFLQHLLYWKGYPPQLQGVVSTISNSLTDKYIPASVLYEKLKVLRDHAVKLKLPVNGS